MKTYIPLESYKKIFTCKTNLRHESFDSFNIPFIFYDNYITLDILLAHTYTTACPEQASLTFLNNILLKSVSDSFIKIGWFSVKLSSLKSFNVVPFKSFLFC